MKSSMIRAWAALICALKATPETEIWGFIVISPFSSQPFAFSVLISKLHFSPVCFIIYFKHKHRRPFKNVMLCVCLVVIYGVFIVHKYAFTL